MNPRKLPSELSSSSWRLTLTSEDPVLDDHRVHGVRIMPGVTFFELLWRGLEGRGLAPSSIELRRCVFRRPASVTDAHGRELRIELLDGPARVVGRGRAQLDDDQPSSWREHFSAELHVLAADNIEPAPRVPTGTPTAEFELERLYATSRALGTVHGPWMRGRGRVLEYDEGLLALVELGDDVRDNADDFYLHPALLDCATLLPSIYFSRTVEAAEPVIPVHVAAVRALARAGQPRCRVWVPRASCTVSSSELSGADLFLLDDDGQLLARMQGLSFKRVREPALITRLSTSVATDPNTSPRPTSSTSSSAAASSQPATGDGALARLRALVWGLVAEQLGRAVPAASMTVGFYELGLDSSDLIDLVARLEARLSIALYPTLLFEHQSIDALARWLSTQALPNTTRADAPVPEAAADEAAADEPPGDITPLFAAAKWVADARPELAPLSGTLLLVDPPRGFAAPDVVIVRSGPHTHAHGDGSWTVETTRVESLRAMLEQLHARGCSPAGVVHFDDGSRPASELLQRLLALLTGLWQTAADVRVPIVHVQTPAEHPHAHAVRALAASSARELPRLPIGVWASDDAPTPTQLRCELARVGGGELVRVRDGVRERLAWTEQPLDSQPLALDLRERCVIITGGLGGLGRLFARTLARHGAALVLSGRRAGDDDSDEFVHELEQLGGRALYVVADVAEAAEVERLVAHARARFGAIHGLIHAAGITDDALIVRRDPSQALAPVAAKIDGLDALVRSCATLEWVVLCSSLAGVVGTLGQAGYAFANGYLDGFAQRWQLARARGEQTGRCVALAWPLWREGGMQIEARAAERLTSFGVPPLDSATGLRSLELALAGRLDGAWLVAQGERARLLATLSAHAVVAHESAARPKTNAPTHAHAPSLRASSSSFEPIAIIGVAGRYPQAPELEQFWANLAAGRDAVTEIPASRWDHDPWYDPTGTRKDRAHTRWGAFIDDVDRFDARLFNVVPREAQIMDPQERLFLEIAWRTFEHAGYPRSALAGQRVGVFVGAMYGHYQLLGLEHALRGRGPAPANFFASIANRVSFHFDLRGPSLALDTMCSSSLTALHLACTSLVRGECRYALVGGVNLMLHPSKYVFLSQARMAASDGRCRAFAAEADGYVPGEGVGAVLLRPLHAAEADGDRVLAVIRGSAINHGGRTSGYSVPSPRAQAEVIREALTCAGVDARTISYVEAHGTGTALGDPIEIEALARVFADHGEAPQRCAIGTVKSNIGHLEPAAGIAGLTKLLLQLEHRTLVPTLHVEVPNPAIDFTRSRFVLQTQTGPWRPRLDEHGRALPLRAALSSFGAGGANAHVIVEQAPERLTQPLAVGPWLFPISAAHADSLAAALERLHAFVRSHEPLELAAVAWTLQVGREPLDVRACVVADDRQTLLDALALAGAHEHAAGPHAWRGRVDLQPSPFEPGDDAATALFSAWANNGRLDRIAAAWVAGAAIDWRALLRGPRPPILSLPGYAFAREHHWLPELASTPMLAPATDDVLGRIDAQAALHGRLCFRRRWRADERLLVDHRVLERAMLPGVTMIVAALEAGRALDPQQRWRVRELVWTAAFELDDDGSRELDTELQASERGYACRFGSAGVTLASCRLEPEQHAPSSTPVLDVGVLATAATDAGTQVYARLREQGIAHGPSLQIITGHGPLDDPRDGARGVCARLGLAPTSEALSIAVLDAALQSMAIWLNTHAGVAEPRLPFAVDGVEVHEPTLRPAYVWARSTDARRFTLDVLSEDGRCCVRLTGVSSRPLPDPLARALFVPRLQASSPLVSVAGPAHWHGRRVLVTGDRSASGLEHGVARALDGARIEWLRGPIDAAALGDEPPALVVHLGGLIRDDVAPDDHQQLHTVEAHALVELLQLVQALLQRGWRTRAIELVALVNRTRAVDHEPRTGLAPLAAGLFGLCGSLASEAPTWTVSCIDVVAPALRDDPSTLARLLQACAETSHIGAALRGVRLYTPSYEPLTRTTAREPAPLAKPGETWLIIGGNGGLGGVLSRELASRGAKLIWLGRRAPDDRIDAARRELEQLGGSLEYVRADIADQAATCAALAPVLDRVGPIHTIVHAAMVLDDVTLERMSEQRLLATLAPKTHGLLTLAHLIDVLAPAQVLLFGSVAAITRSPGQANYAAANAFEDAYAHWLASRGAARVLVVDWGYWGSVGAGATAELRQKMRARGIASIEPHEGLAALARLLSADVTQALVFKGERATLERLGILDAEPHTRAEVPSSPTPPTAIARAVLRPLAQRVDDYLARVFLEVVGLRELDLDADFGAFGLDSVMVIDISERLSRDLGAVPATLLFEHDSPRRLARALLMDFREALERLLAPAEPVSLPAAPEPASEPESAPAPRASAPASVDEPIAIIGVAGRYPGGRDLDGFWAKLRAGASSIVELSDARFDWREHFDPTPGKPGRNYSRWAGLIEGVDEFDSLFFKISPREAESMDPQERLFLQTAWALLEQAGHTRASIGGSDRSVGVFVGVMYGDYARLGAVCRDRGVWTPANAPYWSVANRVSYLFDLQGPSLAIDSACSSSLTAIHLACESLRRRECRVAIAGGVSVIADADHLRLLANVGMLGRSDACRPFGAGADGFIDGEGVGALLLAPLSEAERRGDRILAVIAGSAINAGGKTSGYSVPNPGAQAAVITTALARAGWDPATIGYVEAHGTGTELGDPIELRGLTRAWQAAAIAPLERGRCAIGSVKSNIGHLEAAAGIAGVTKLLLQLEHGELVPSLHADPPNPHVALLDSPFRVQLGLAPWHGARRRAALSSFGAGGANAHVLIESYDAAPAPVEQAGPRPLLLSARDHERLRELAAALRERLGRAPAPRLVDVAFTLACGREPMATRLGFVARDLDHACACLDAYLDGRTADIHTGETNPRESSEASRRVETHDDLDACVAAWVAGAQLDWSPLVHAEGRRIALPTYPFARERHWLPDSRRSADEPMAEHDDEPTRVERPGQRDGETRFRRRLSGRDPIAREHVVNGRPLLPGVALLAMISSLARRLPDAPPHASITALTWARPLVLDDALLGVDVVVTATELGIRVRVERWDASGEALPLAHATLVAGPRESSSPAISVAHTCEHGERLSADDCYAGFEAAGIHLGPSLRRIAWLRRDAGRALARLHAPTHARAIDRWGLLDAALQTVAAVLGHTKASGPTPLPAALGRFVELGPIEQAAYALAERTATDRYDVRLLDADGRTLVAFEQLELRAPADVLAGKCFVPVWRAVPRARAQTATRSLAVVVTAHARAHVQRLVAQLDVPTTIIDLDEHVGARVLAAAPERLVLVAVEPVGGRVDPRQIEALTLAVLALTRTLLDGGWVRPRRSLVLITARVQAVRPQDAVDPRAATLPGLLMSLAREHAALELGCVDIGALAELDRACLLDEPGSALLGGVALREGRRYAAQLEPLTLPTGAAPLRERGVYVIVGGLGGIGLELACALATRVHARLLLLGRSALDVGLADKLARIEAAGGEPLYVQADAADEAAVHEAVARARARFGTIHGVFHSAIVLRDRSLVRMRDDELRDVLRPKLAGSVYLFDALADEQLDFALFFSSAQALSGSPGQANYAAACTFEDSFAHSLRARGLTRAHTINWGYWGEVGIVRAPEYRERVAKLGVEALSVAEGLAVIERTLVGGPPALVALAASPTTLTALGVQGPSSDAPSIRLAALDVAGPPALDRELLLTLERGFARCTTLAVRELATELRPYLGDVRGGVVDRDALVRALAPAPSRVRLLDALVELLARHGQLAPNVESLSPARLEQDWAALLAEHAELGPHARLVRTCIASCVEVLRGSLPGTTVLFPNGSLELVELTYRGNPIADYFNDLLTASVVALVEAMHAAQPDREVRLLEVGAGTGGTTAFVLPALAKLRGPIEYTFSDVGPGFVEAARKQFAARFPFVRCTGFDLERDVVAQGLAPAGFDIVIGANVVHATRELAVSVDRIAQLLRPDGWLVLNEATAVSDFLTMTFGLVDGWWSSIDAERRLAHSPLLDADGWRALLRERGFAQVTGLGYPSPLGGELGQHLLLGCNAGEVRVATVAAETSPVRERPTAPTPTPTPAPTRTPTPAPTPVRRDDDALRRRLERVIGESLEQALGVSLQRIDGQLLFADYGVDSITGVALINAVGERIGLVLRTSLLFDCPSVAEFVDWLIDHHREQLDDHHDPELEALQRLAAGELDIDQLQQLLP